MPITFLHEFCKKNFQSNKHIVRYIKKCADMQVGLQTALYEF